MKFMNLKRFASLAMAGAMALSLAVPAFAVDDTVITATYEEVPLEVDVPGDTDAIINPFGLPVALDEEETIFVSGQQIVTPTMVVKNKSAVALKFAATVTGDIPAADGGATNHASFATTAVQPNDAGNSIFVEFEAFAAPTVTDDTDSEAVDKLYAALDSADRKVKATVAATDVPASDVDDGLILREGKEGATQRGGAAFIRLTGSMAQAPTTNPWAETDSFTVTIAYTFTPDEYVVTLGTAATGAEAITGTASKEATWTITGLPTGIKVNTATVKWVSSNTSYATVVAKSSTTTALIGTVTGVTGGTADITVTFKGTDGITYSSAPMTVTVT